MRTFTSLLAILLLTGPSMAQTTGTWYAVLRAGGQRIPLNVEITEDGDGFGGTLQSPSQSEVRMPLASVRLTLDSLTFGVTAVGIGYVGQIFGGDSISGTFQQSTFSIPLTFYREPPQGYSGEVPIAEVRFQDPTDFPYGRESINFPSLAEGVQLAGELTLPADTFPKALLVLVSGSGPQDRNEDLGPQINHRPFLVLSDYLTRLGYGVLRYDDRGIGESSGQFRGATSGDFVEDAQGAVRYLRDRGELETIPIGIVGHSEGGMIAEMIAASGEIDFTILLAAPGHAIDSLMNEQRRKIGGGGKAPTDDDYHRAVYAYLKAHPEADESAIRSGILATVTALASSKATGEDAALANGNFSLSDYADTYAEPWMRYFITFDPSDYLSRITVPVLALNGDLDVQVDVSNLETIETVLKKAGNEDVTIIAAPGLNHLFQPAVSGLPDEYGQIETTFAPGVLKGIGHWLNKRF